MKPKNPLEIFETGLTLRLDGYLYIDTTLWTTQAQLSKKLKVKRNVINNRVRRGEQTGRLRTYYIEAINTKLIPNVQDINELCRIEKKQ